MRAMTPLAATAISALALSANAAPDTSSPYVANGCYQCHGYAAQGGAGARLSPNPPALATFIRLVRRPLNAMPPYTEKVLSDQQLADIHAYRSEERRVGKEGRSRWSPYH